MYRKILQTEHLKFEFRLTSGGGRVNVSWRWNNTEGPTLLKIFGHLENKPVPDDVAIDGMEMPEGADFDALCEHIEKTVRTEYATISKQRPMIYKELRERFNGSRSPI